MGNCMAYELYLNETDIYVYTYIHIHTYVYTYIHVHICTYIYTYIFLHLLLVTLCLHDLKQYSFIHLFIQYVFTRHPLSNHSFIQQVYIDYPVPGTGSDTEDSAKHTKNLAFVLLPFSRIKTGNKQNT